MRDKPEENIESKTELLLSSDALQAFLEKFASEHDDDKPATNREPKNSDDDEDLHDEDEEDEESEKVIETRDGAPKHRAEDSLNRHFREAEQSRSRNCASRATRWPWRRRCATRFRRSTATSAFTALLQSRKSWNVRWSRN